MNEVVMLRGAEPRRILQTAIDEKVPAIMTYLSRGKWHVAKVLLTELMGDKLRIEGIRSPKKPHPINICVHQPLGISFKYGQGKFVFDTSVVALEPSQDPASGGTIVLMAPGSIEVVQRRNYFRVQVPQSLKVNVLLWHRRCKEAENVPCRQQQGLPLPQKRRQNTKYEPQNYYQGTLVDLSAGGAQLVIPSRPAENPDVGRGSFGMSGSDFRKGQFLGVRFTPMPYETPLVFNAQIRNILPAEDNENIYLGLQIVGLEASLEGRQVLARLVGVVERYFKINQTGAKLQDMKPVSAGPPL